MASRRTLKAAEAIREVVATSILTDLKDPRARSATITRVEVSEDMRQAKVYFMTLGGESKERLVLRGLQSAAGFFQQKCAKRIDSRYTPTLQFFIDEGKKNLIAVSQVLADERAEAERKEAEENSDLDDDEVDEDDESDDVDEEEEDSERK